MAEFKGQHSFQLCTPRFYPIGHFPRQWLRLASFLKQFLHVSSWERLSSSRWRLVMISLSPVMAAVMSPMAPMACSSCSATGHLFRGIHCSRVLFRAISVVESLWRAANCDIGLRISWTKRLHSYVTMRCHYHVWSCWQQVLSFMCSCVTVLLMSCRSCFGFGRFKLKCSPRWLWLS